MGNVKNYFQDWLDRGGYSLGYDINPKLTKNKIFFW